MLRLDDLNIGTIGSVGTPILPSKIGKIPSLTIITVWFLNIFQYLLFFCCQKFFFNERKPFFAAFKSNRISLELTRYNNSKIYSGEQWLPASLYNETLFRASSCGTENRDCAPRQLG